VPCYSGGLLEDQVMAWFLVALAISCTVPAAFAGADNRHGVAYGWFFVMFMLVLAATIIAPFL